MFCMIIHEQAQIGLTFSDLIGVVTLACAFVKNFFCLAVLCFIVDYSLLFSVAHE